MAHRNTNRCHSIFLGGPGYHSDIPAYESLIHALVRLPQTYIPCHTRARGGIQ